MSEVGHGADNGWYPSHVPGHLMVCVRPDRVPRPTPGWAGLPPVIEMRISSPIIDFLARRMFRSG